MRNAEVKQMRVADNNALVGLLAKACQEEKKDQHLAFSIRLATLSIHAQQKSILPYRSLSYCAKRRNGLNTQHRRSLHEPRNDSC